MGDAMPIFDPGPGIASVTGLAYASEDVKTFCYDHFMNRPVTGVEGNNCSYYIPKSIPSYSFFGTETDKEVVDAYPNALRIEKYLANSGPIYRIFNTEQDYAWWILKS